MFPLRQLLVGLLLLFPASAALAQPAPRQVVELRASTSFQPSKGGPLGGLPSREGVVFAVHRADTGVELWGTDSKIRPARRLLDLCPLLEPERFAVVSNPIAFERKGLVYFAGGCVGARSLWVSDGTSAGTRIVDPSFTPGSSIGQIPGSEDLLVFGSGKGVSGIWVFEGRGEVLRRVASGRPLRSRPLASAPLARSLVFTAADFLGRISVWASDGTAEGTVRLLETDLLEFNYDRLDFVSVNGRVLFALHSELWATDGSAQGTLKLIESGGDSGNLGILPGETQAFVERSGACWVTNGTAAGTRLTSNCAAIVWGDRGYFAGDDRWWSFDGSGAPAQLVPGLPTGSWSGLHASKQFGLALQRRPTQRGPAELWVQKTLQATPKLVLTAASSSILGPYAESGGNLFFADEITENGSEVVPRLWRSNGTIGGTTELLRGVSFFSVLDLPFSFRSDGAWWIGVGGQFQRVYRFDDEATLVAAIPTHDFSLIPEQLRARGDSLYLTSLERYSHSSTLRRVRGTEVETLVGSPTPIQYRPLDSGVAYWNGDEPYDLWWLDGAGSHSLYSTRAVSNDLGGRALALEETADGGLLFVDFDGLYRVNPDAVRVDTVRALPRGIFGQGSHFQRQGADHFFFHRLDFGLNAGSLWRTDGTSQGTVQVADVAGVLLAAGADRLLWFGDDGRLWTQAYDGASPRSLEAGPDPRRFAVIQPFGKLFCLPFSSATWVSDGTEAGTLKVKDRIEPWRSAGAGESVGGVAYQDRCYFSAEDSEHGYELWSTDGTVAGTRIVADLFPGPAGSFPSALTVVGDRLLFRASDGVHGSELWSTDGTAAGTVRLTDLALGPASSDPDAFTVWGNELVFVASDGGENGRQLWGLPLGSLDEGEASQPPAPDGEWLQSPQVSGFRFKVRIAGTTSGRLETACLPETVCVSGALPGRPEVFLRVVGPKPNGFLWPTLVKFSTSEVEVWVDQIGLGTRRYYRLAGARPGVDELPALFDREGFLPSSARSVFAEEETRGGEPPAGAQWTTTAAIPGFRFAVTIAGDPARPEANCLAETLCLSGAIAGRSEVFVRVVGPKPNGFLWPTLARFTTSEVEVWIEQLATGARQHYQLAGAAPGHEDLTGSFDREGFLP